MVSPSQTINARIARLRRSIVRAGLAAALIGVAQSALILPAAAQDSRIIHDGNMAITGFPGTHIPGFEDGLPPGVDPVDETFIDPESASLRIFDVSALGAAAQGQLVNSPPAFEVKAQQIGQVFGLAYDDGKRDDTDEIIPSLYATATSLHGLQIVVDDEDDDGRPERIRRGKEGARFMEGQFGEELGGGPGSIYRIDGQSGEVTLFATIDTNSGAGLGNIAFDPRSRQFFVSDVDTGLVHRISINGELIDTFDHGVDGRPAHGLDPIEDDGSVMDIAGGVFDTEDTDTWGFTPAERRVWGLGVHRSRLYYAVEKSSQIWSVGIGRDGSFTGDPRWELDVNAPESLAVTDIAFDKRGFMYLAQRGEIENRFDYSYFAKSGKGEVMRYFRESPDDPATASVWVETPQTYATGFPAGHQQTAGGVSLQYGYDALGNMRVGACDATLFKTGDNLRYSAEHGDKLAENGSTVVHGSQLTDVTLVRPKNEPPFGSWFFDFDGFHEDPEVRGHVGDVEVFQLCDGVPQDGYPGYGDPIDYPGDPGDPGRIPDPESPCVDIEDIVYDCTPAGDVLADLYVTDKSGYGLDALQSRSLTAGVGVAPKNQTRPSPLSPFTLEMSGTIPGDKIGLGLCFYKDADAKEGGYFPCCKVNITVETPAFACK